MSSTLYTFPLHPEISPHIFDLGMEAKYPGKLIDIPKSWGIQWTQGKASRFSIQIFKTYPTWDKGAVSVFELCLPIIFLPIFFVLFSPV